MTEQQLSPEAFLAAWALCIRTLEEIAAGEAADGQVRKGETGSLVVYADKFTKSSTDANGADVEIEIQFMKGYAVFNAEQIDRLPGHFYATQPPLVCLCRSRHKHVS